MGNTVQGSEMSQDMSNHRKFGLLFGKNRQDEKITIKRSGGPRKGSI